MRQRKNSLYSAARISSRKTQTLAAEHPPLGPHLQQIRKKKRLTLDQLAAMSGVSRSMLSQIERGETNPTFATLWNLTSALGIDLSDLIKGEGAKTADTITLVSRHFTPEIRTADGSCVLHILSPAANAGGVEWYDLTVKPGGALVSESHAAGSVEHLTVLEGSLEVQSDGQTQAVGQGETARYPTDVPHAIRNKGKAVARALLVVMN